MMMAMSSPKEEILILLGSVLIILLLVSGTILSLGSSQLNLSSFGTIDLRGREFPSSTFAYRIFKNLTSTYRINSTGFVDDHYSDPAVVINNAMRNCSAAGGGSVYVVPNTYIISTFIGGNPLYNHDFSNVYLELGNGTIIQRNGGTGAGDYMFFINNYGTGTINFTLTSNGTAIFDAKNYCNGAQLRNIYNSTMTNIKFQHLYGQGIGIGISKYCKFENVTVFSYDEGYEGGSMFGVGDTAYSSFRNIYLDGNNQALSRIGLYLGDWDNKAWHCSFNIFENITVRNLRRDGIYLNSGATGYGVYNNTFNNVLVENNWQGGYNAIKLRPAQNNTFTNTVIRNFTDPITTGTSYDSGETPGNCTGNSITATIYGSTLTSFILTTDGNNQSVDNNFFNLTIINSKGCYFSSRTNSPIHSNTFYLNITNSGGLYFEAGHIQDNIFVANFSNCGVSGHADIWFYSTPRDPNIGYNTIYIIGESGNPYGQLEGILGTNQIINGPPP